MTESEIFRLKEDDKWLYRGYTANKVEDPSIDMADVNCNPSESIILRNFEMGTKNCSDDKLDSAIMKTLVGRNKPVSFKEAGVELGSIKAAKCMYDPKVQKESVIQFQYKCATPTEFDTWKVKNNWV